MAAEAAGVQDGGNSFDSNVLDDHVLTAGLPRLIAAMCTKHDILKNTTGAGSND